MTRRKIAHSKRFKDYPKNVPKKLFNVLKIADFSISTAATILKVNSGHISSLINDGVEPKNPEIRKKLFLKSYSICNCCKRKILYRTKQIQNRKEIPEYIKKWKHLSTVEREKVIRQYLEWKNKQ